MSIGWSGIILMATWGADFTQMFESIYAFEYLSTYATAVVVVSLNYIIPRVLFWITQLEMWDYSQQPL